MTTTGRIEVDPLPRHGPADPGCCAATFDLRRLQDAPGCAAECPLGLLLRARAALGAAGATADPVAAAASTGLDAAIHLVAATARPSADPAGEPLISTGLAAARAAVGAAHFALVRLRDRQRDPGS
ncbi:hypothetical protein [Amycolatopsis antarctica]|uniref:hypothetical protein n=1 Tax=Amycolatopsis antarctica TaxID=1854586 RepID=UPI0013FD1367|nr:hypothetical protein [Amycolatopsis antarctica]